MTHSNQPFISRVRLLKNLQQHLLRGRWAAMIGGPMIGKTTLASHLVNCINQEKSDAPQTRAIFVTPAETKDPQKFWSLMAESILNKGLFQEDSSQTENVWTKPPTTLSDLISQLQPLFDNVPPEQSSQKLILIIDDCDHLLNLSKELIPEIVTLAFQFQKCRPGLHAVCWVGGPTWGDWVSKNAALFKVPVRSYPLSVIPIREARAIIQNHLGSSEVARIWQLTGGHPFLLERYLEGKVQTQTPEGDPLMKNLSKRLSQGLKPEEEAILSQLDPEGGWMPLEALKGLAGGRPPEKETLDRLCMIGLIVRTLDQGSAVVRKTSRFLL